MSDERPTHAPCFVGYGEDEPRTVSGFGLTDTTDRRTFAVKSSTHGLPDADCRR
jgi:hypothetical protein